MGDPRVDCLPNSTLILRLVMIDSLEEHVTRGDLCTGRTARQHFHYQGRFKFAPYVTELLLFNVHTLLPDLTYNASPFLLLSSLLAGNQEAALSWRTPYFSRDASPDGDTPAHRSFHKVRFESVSIDGYNTDLRVGK